ncbi:MAG: enoyl-CoA hydratase/isomerase family protein [Candidatus Omnitrophica bacterium]|nr:enoyl-CoA hydratase/isomerase family protein [Candidatus Omnitrophota bacterium]
MNGPIVSELKSGVLRIALKDPERRNAISLEMLEALAEALQAAEQTPDARVVLLHAHGAAFSAGMDLKRVDLGDAEVAERFAARLASVYRNLQRIPLPVLCAVDGPAMGGAVGLVLAADLIFAGPSARFALSETRIGLVPALVSVVARRRLTAGKLKALAVSGTTVDASEAYRLGMVDFLAEQSALREAEDFARKLLRENSGEAITRTKRFLSGSEPADLDQELDRAQVEFRAAAASASARAGLAAFREKRPLNWGEPNEVGM